MSDSEDHDLLVEDARTLAKKIAFFLRNNSDASMGYRATLRECYASLLLLCDRIDGMNNLAAKRAESSDDLR